MAGVQPSATVNGTFANALPAMPDLVIPFHEHCAPFPTPSPEMQDRYTFLQDVQWDEHIGSGAEVWYYDSRRHAQPILPFLYLGPRTAVKNLAQLREQGITMLVALYRTDFEASLLDKPLREAGSLGFTVFSTMVSSYQSIPAICKNTTPQMLTFLQGSKVETGKHAKILVCCETGNEMSAAIVCAFLIDVLRCDMAVAIRIIHARRFSVSLNDPMKHALLAYEDISKARRAAEDPMPPQIDTIRGPRQVATKRKLTTEGNSDDASTHSSDSAEQQWRTYAGPFTAPTNDSRDTPTDIPERPRF